MSALEPINDFGHTKGSEASPVELGSTLVEPVATLMKPVAAPVEPGAAPVEPEAAPVEPGEAPVDKGSSGSNSRGQSKNHSLDIVRLAQIATCP